MSMNFTPKSPDENEYFAHDFRRLLDTGEQIISAPWFVTVVEGTDPDPQAMVFGGAVINGSKVSQRIAGGVVDTRYCLKCRALTSAGQTIELAADLWVRAACTA